MLFSTKILLCLLAHFLSDFVCQSRDMGRLKSSDYRYLGAHVLITWMFFLPFGLKFSTINALLHGLIDKNIWTGYKLSVRMRNANATAETWRYWNDHWFYVTIGLDQLMHISTLVILLELLG